MSSETLSYTMLPSALGTFGLVWRDEEQGPKVYRVFLPNERARVGQLIGSTFTGARARSSPMVSELGARIQAFSAGDPVALGLDLLALEQCSDWQARVLRAEHCIPRGWVSTYGRIAAHLGQPRGARAVGSALARNPFPIIIPCHRAIRSDGRLGGFQGGSDMKRALLELEGVEVSGTGTVLAERFYY